MTGRRFSRSSLHSGSWRPAAQSLALAWWGSYLPQEPHRAEPPVALAHVPELSLLFIAIWTGWFTAEVEVATSLGQVYGVPKNRGCDNAVLWDGVHGDDLARRLCAVYLFIFGFGVIYIYWLLRAGPVDRLVLLPVGNLNRPMSVIDEHAYMAVHATALMPPPQRAPVAGE